MKARQHKQLAAWRELRFCANCFCWDRFFNDVIYCRSWKSTLRWRARLTPVEIFERTLVVTYCSRNAKLYDCESCYLKLLRPSFFSSTRGCRWKSHWPFPSFNIHAFAHFTPKIMLKQMLSGKTFPSHFHHLDIISIRTTVSLFYWWIYVPALTPANGWS